MSCTTLKYFLTTPELHHRSLLDIPSSRRVSLTWSSSSDHPSQRENDFAVLLQNSTLQLLPCPRSRHTWRIFLLAFYLRGSYWTSACGASLSPSSPWGWSSASCCCCRSYCWSSPSPTKSHPTYQTRLFTHIQLELLWTQSRWTWRWTDLLRALHERTDPVDVIQFVELSTEAVQSRP